MQEVRLTFNWNEDELKFQFIAQIVELVDLHGKNFNIFSQRNLSAVVNGITLQGRPEVMVAIGQEDPLRLYFFIHEYKADETLGQVLAVALIHLVLLTMQHKPTTYTLFILFFIKLNG